MYPAPGPFGQKTWTDAGGIEWKVHRVRRGRLVTLINDAHVPVREFDRWTAEIRTLTAEEAQMVVTDLEAGRHEIAAFCQGIDVAEARNEEHGSEVWVGRI